MRGLIFHSADRGLIYKANGVILLKGKKPR
jgi:hypothetical protein